VSSTAQADHAINVLLVEDSLPDVELTQQAFKDAKFCNPLFVVRDGEQALRFLRRQTPFENAERPDLVLLDLNLPKVNGREVLAAIRADPRLSLLPVVILTTSQSEEDVIRSYQLKANAYVTKPVDASSFISIVRQIQHFWISVVTLPPRDAP
jgi:CheY-like chemotaxis protein